MEINSISFLVFFIVALVLYGFHENPDYKQVALLVINSVFVASFASSFLNIAPFLIFILIGYASLQIIHGTSHPKRLYVLMALIIGSFIFLKQFSVIRLLPNLPFNYMTVGISYILFRIIHLLVDVHGGVIKKRISLLMYLNYVCFFLNFTSGPIQRFTDFIRQVSDVGKSALSQEIVYHAFSRGIRGCLKIIIVSPLLFYFHSKFLVQFTGSEHIYPIVHLVPLYCGAAVLYVYYLYFNFSGYMDVVIGAGKLLRIDLPENFNHPFHASDFLDLWSRWHITLSEWFKFYVFNPFLKALTSRWNSSCLEPYFGVAAFFLTFLVMGLWHGTTGIFFFYGLFLGFGVSANKLYQVLMTKRLGKKNHQHLIHFIPYVYGCRGLTFAYFAIAVTCFWVDVNQLRVLAQALGLWGVSGALVLLMTTAAGAMYLWDHTTKFVDGFGIVERMLPRGFLTRTAWLAAEVVFIFCAGPLLDNSVQEFVYKAF